MSSFMPSSRASRCSRPTLTPCQCRSSPSPSKPSEGAFRLPPGSTGCDPSCLQSTPAGVHSSRRAPVVSSQQETLVCLGEGEGVGVQALGDILRDDLHDIIVASNHGGCTSILQAHTASQASGAQSRVGTHRHHGRSLLRSLIRRGGR